MSDASPTICTAQARAAGIRPLAVILPLLVAPTLVPTATPTLFPAAAPTPNRVIAAAASGVNAPVARPVAAPAASPVAAPVASPAKTPVARPVVAPVASRAGAPVAGPGPAAGDVALTLLGTTDVHGHLLPIDYYTGRRTDFGLTLLAPLVDSVRAAHPGDVYLFDSGDILEGNPLAYVYARLEPRQPSPIIGAMNRLGYAAAAVGNHEYNYGLPYLGRAMRQARFPFVTANVFRHGTDEHAYRSYILIPHPTPYGDTILIGVTGNTPPGVALWDRAHVHGVLDFRDVVTSLRPVVREMRARGADVVVLLSHGGLQGTSYDTVSTGLPPENEAARVAREIPGIDVIFLGHTHRQLADSTINGVLLTQAKNFAHSLADVTLTLHRRGRDDWVVVSKRARLLRPRAGRQDPGLAAYLAAANRRTLAWVRSPVGRATATMSARRARVEDTPILDFINAVQRQAAGAQLSSTAAFNLRARLPRGTVTIADIAGLYTYDNTLKAVRITGAQLRAYLEKSAAYYNGWPPPPGGTVVNRAVPGYNYDVVSGVDYTLDLRRPVGHRVTSLTWHGKPVRPDQTFTLALNNYRQGGGGGFSMLASAPVVYDHQQDIRSLLIAAVQQKGVIRPGDYFHRNWRIVPRAAADSALKEETARMRPPARATSPAGARANAGARADAGGAANAGGAAPTRARLRVIATNDLHGHLVSESFGWTHGRKVGGAATLDAYFRRERRSFHGPVVLLSGGDMMQGTPISNLSQGRASIAFYDAAGYDAAAIGNHDFDWGIPVLRQRMAQARFPWLSANIFVAHTDTAPSWIHPTALLRVDGERVGIIGLSTDETPTTTRPSNVAGLSFRDGAAAIDRWVPVLRREGAQFVVVVAHSGAVCGGAGNGSTRACHGEVIDWARRVRHRPDLIVAAHTHRDVQTRVNGIPIVEAGAYGERYEVVDLRRIASDSVVATLRAVTPWRDAVTADSAVAALVARYRAAIGPRLNRVVATLADSLPRRGREYALGHLIADAQRAATGAQVAIMNNGGIRTSLPAGPVTWRQLFELQPFANQLVVLRLSGARLRETMEHVLAYGEGPDAQISGLRVWYDGARPRGHRVLRMELADGRTVRPDDTYTVTVNDFMADGGSGFTALTHAASRRNTGIVDLDALIQYLEKRPQPVHVATAHRFRVVPSTRTRGTP